jgi:hypothetical protein
MEICFGLAFINDFFIHVKLLMFRNLFNRYFVTSDLINGINQCSINISIFTKLFASEALTEAQMKLKR